MVIAVQADKSQKEALLAKSIPDNVEVIWADSVKSLTIIEADAYFDLLFEWNMDRIAALRKLLPQPIIVNAVAYTTKAIGAPFTRINAWPTMLERAVTEVAVPTANLENIASLFDQLQWKYEVVPDICGMITPAIVTMIINEAWYTYDAGTSSKEEIDIAMKLGTNYPYGPFEWGEKIGVHRIVQLLKELGRTSERYTIAQSLLEIAQSSPRYTNE